ncbi:MAG: hypothetical protein JWQ98_448 [Chlorobi bacterium]|nr:hypothetical protein [Chlorobiota bacterium]
MFTITTRLTLRYLLIFGTIVSAIVVVMYTVFESNERDSFDAELRDYAEFLVSGVNTSTGSVSDMFDNLQDVTGQANLRFRSKWFLLMTRDSVVYESGQQDSIEDMVDSLQTMLPNRGRPKFRTIQANGITYRAFALSIPNTQKLRLGIVVVGSLDRLEATLERLRNILLIIVPASLLLAGVGGWFTARRALAPVAEITSAAAAISSSNLHQRVSGGNSTDELAQLASTFNAMIERLELTFNSQRRFVADASHDLRTPLMVIQAKLDHILTLPEIDPPVREDLEHCLTEVDRMSRLANDLLLLAKADAHQLRLIKAPERLDEIVVDCVSKLKNLAGQRNISLWVDVDDAVEFSCDSATLQRAIMNVITNAITYSHESSTVTTRLTAQDRAALITISDNGPGIPASDIPQIFDRFYRSDTARSTPGSGLGLAIARTIIEAHDGTIAIASEEGKGTIVTIGLPAEIMMDA